MALNKKQKRQLDVAHKKLTHLKRLLAAARRQPDDPDEIPRLKREIEQVEEQVEKLKEG